MDTTKANEGGVEELLNRLLVTNCSLDQQTSAANDDKIIALYGIDETILATTLIHRGLFLENLLFFHKLNRDSWRIYSYICNRNQNTLIHYSDDNNDDSAKLIGQYNECLIKLTKCQPMKSYLKLSFRQILNFILKRSDNCQYLVDVPYLLSFINEIRTSYNTLCPEDRRALRPPSKFVFNESFVKDSSENAFFLIGWSIIEAAKYCITNKFSHLGMTANELLNLLQKEASSLPMSFSDKISKRVLVNFIQNLDKFLQDRVQESSTGKYTFSEQSHSNVEQFYKVNCSIFHSWLLKNRQNFARLSLSIDDPAECWRNANLKLCLDLAAKFNDFSLNSDRNLSFSQTLMSLNTKNWYVNLSLIALSAKQLGDLRLLYGIRALIDLRGIICEYPPLSNIISNLEGSYEQTYNAFKSAKTNQNQVAFDEQSLVEFLNSCIELDLLEENCSQIENLKSDRTRKLFEKFLESKRNSKTTSANDANREEKTVIAPKSRLEEVNQWLSSWATLGINNEDCSLNETTSAEIYHCQSTKSYIDLIVPTCLNIIATTSPDTERQELIEQIEKLIGQDFIAQCLFPSSYINTNIKVYHVLIELLKDRENLTTIVDDLVRQHSNDLHWNHLLYRHLFDLNLVDKLRNNHRNEAIDLIQFRAAKFHRKHKNELRAKSIAEDLIKNARSCDVKLKSSFLLIKDDLPEHHSNDLLRKLALKIKQTELIELETKSDLISKVLRRTLRQSIFGDKNELDLFNIFYGNHQNDADKFNQRNIPSEKIFTTFARWQILLDSCSLGARIKTLAFFSKRSNEQLQLLPNDDKLVNENFVLDLRLLETVCQSTSLEKHKSLALDVATRTLKQISVNHLRLNHESLERFTAEHFVKYTSIIWLTLKANLIAIICHQDDLSCDWLKALITIVKSLGQSHPNAFIYEITVNRLDLQDELTNSNEDSESASVRSSISQDLPSILQQQQKNKCYAPSELEIQDSSSKKFQNFRKRLAFWNELFGHMKETTNDKFDEKTSLQKVFSETERFLKEIRKISFLCGEYFKILTIRISRILHNFLDYFSKNCDTISRKILAGRQRLEDCELRLKAVCEQALNPIQLLLNYGKKIGESQLTKYDIWFCETFNKQLHELEYRLNLLAKKKPLIFNEIEKLVKSVTELLAVCRQTLSEYNHSNRQKLYMELISPVLSRLEPSLIPMPECYKLEDLSFKPMITIHKISQTVNLIASKTSPKKLKIIGSDGVSRSFLLKAHEDLRLDQFMMNLFGSINRLLKGNKETQSGFRIRKYSVTPVSSRSGLIQWVEAPSICSSYRAWLVSPNGKKVIDELFSTTCGALCEDENSSVPLSEHQNCQPVPSGQVADIFYQLLWAKTRPTKKQITQTRPSLGNIVKYRNEFDSSYFQSVVEQLVIRMPNELIANQFWYRSTNSQSYWLKTQEFIRSCATISIVGYLIGLGDRHPENILLDYNTGEVVHIDYNICFEFGKSLNIPEKVPFRLTQNIIHAFGFAGLEGGFTYSCRSVLNVLKQSKSTLLHLFDPINLKFMISDDVKSNKLVVDSDLEIAIKLPEANSTNYPPQIPLTNEQPRTNLVTNNRPTTQAGDLDICSQELSIELNPTNGANLNDLLLLNNAKAVNATKVPVMASNATSDIQQHQQQQVVPTGKNKPTYMEIKSLDLQQNIKKPVKVTTKDALNIYERIKDKLSGTDECVRHYKYQQDCNEKQVKQLLDPAVNEGMKKYNEETIDLIMLNDAQTTEDQVDALIVEATSIKNKAAMFEGWIPWI